MFDKYKIFLFESEFKNKTVNICCESLYTREFDFTIRRRGEDEILSRSSAFNFSETRLREYFNNSSYYIHDFRAHNQIDISHDIDLSMELQINKLKINATHSDHIGGFIFNETTLDIDEVKYASGTVIRNPFKSIKISSNKRLLYFRYLPLKAKKIYRFSLFDDIIQRIYYYSGEKYDVDIDFSLRFYLTTTNKDDPIFSRTPLGF